MNCQSFEDNRIIENGIFDFYKQICHFYFFFAQGHILESQTNRKGE